MRQTLLISLILSAMLTACGGNSDSNSPVVNQTPPDTTINSGPAAATTSSSATFTFSASESGATFEASLDGGAFSAVTSPMSFSALGAGTHTFSVRARDASGNADATPATFTWAVDLVPPSARIVFPTANSYTDASTLTVRGNANDAHGVSAVSVNGVPATSSDGFQTWQAVVPIASGYNSLVVAVTDAAGNVDTSATTASVINRGPANYSMAGMDYDATGDRIVTADTALNAIYYYAADGIAHVLSPTPGTANGLYDIADLAIDAPRNRAILVEYYLDALVAVDLTTGARSVIVPTAGGAASATTFVNGSVITVDSVNNRAFVTNPSSSSIIGVDLVTGARSLVSGGAVGSGAALAKPAGLIYDNLSAPGTPRLLVSDGGTSEGLIAGEIVAVDPATGNRTQAFPTFPVSTGTLLDTPNALRLDAANHRLLVVDTAPRAVFGIDLTTGNRTVLNSDVVSTSSTLTRLAFNPSSSRLFTNALGGGIIAIDLTNQQHGSFANSSVGSGLTLNYPEGLVIEQASGTPASVLLTDRGLSTLMRLNLATGIRTAASDSSGGIGSGPSLVGSADVVLDTRTSSSGHTALVIVDFPSYQLLSVDLATGDRTQIASLNSSAPPIGHVSHMRLDASGNRVLFTDATYGGNNALYAIDLATGVRRTITDSSHGTGPAFTFAANITLDPSTSPTRALISDQGLGGIFAVDLATGNRTVLINPFANVSSPGDNVPSGTFLDVRNSRLLSLRVGAVSNLFSVALPGASQQIIAGDDPTTSAITGTGPLPFGCFALDVSTTDGVAFVACPWITTIMAVDLVSGDRVIVGR